MPKPLIRLHAHEPYVVTAQEFSTLQRELSARAMVDDLTLSDRIVLRLLVENHYRFVECMELEKDKS